MTDQLQFGATPTPSPAADATTVEGVVERIVFESADTGFFVGRLREENNPELVTFVGSGIAVTPGETIRISGSWRDDPRFGRQIRVEQYQTLLPTSAEGIEKYLASGLVSGVGPVYAKRLVERFGRETLRIIDESPKRLLEVPGIGRKRYEQIREAWESQREVQAIMVFLQSHGIGAAHAARIYKTYGGKAVAVIRENPYRLAEEVGGIGFSGADAIARQMGVESDSPKRIAAGLRHLLREAAGEGQLYVSRATLCTNAAEALSLDPGPVEIELRAGSARGEVVTEEDRVYLTELHADEEGVARELHRLLTAPKAVIDVDAPKAVAWCQQHFRIEFSEEQAPALENAIGAPVFVITGGPGTGKTTLIRSLLTVFDRKGLHVTLTAPTGRAAKRMDQATGHSAATIHRLLEYSPRQQSFTHDEYNQLDTDVVIVDETSMVDVPLMHALLRAVPDAARLYFVGDVDQLPSVGPGAALFDIIASGTIPTARLKHIHRQAGGSGIVAAAHAVNRGDIPKANSTDFFVIERETPERIQETVVELLADRIPNRFNLDRLTGVQVLTPVHRGPAGVQQLNAVLQEALNPGNPPVARGKFRIGDKVIQTRNDYDLDVYNGDSGIVESFDEDNSILSVRFDEHCVRYEPAATDNLALAYATTIHKSQGSEYPAVVIPLAMQHYALLQRNVLYTAVTRAQRLAILVTQPKALRAAIGNTRSARRNTTLVERLRRLDG